jgi:hypothetical protein
MIIIIMIVAKDSSKRDIVRWILVTFSPIYTFMDIWMNVHMYGYEFIMQKQFLSRCKYIITNISMHVSSNNLDSENIHTYPFILLIIILIQKYIKIMINRTVFTYIYTSSTNIQ